MRSIFTIPASSTASANPETTSPPAEVSSEVGMYTEARARDLFRREFRDDPRPERWSRGLPGLERFPPLRELLREPAFRELFRRDVAERF